MPASLPEAALRPAAQSAADLAACRAMMRTGSRSFFAAARVLPRRVRDPATALYAFCRLADDLIDEGGADAGAPVLARLRERLDRACAGRPADHPADRALAETMLRHRMPAALPLALLEGFAWDLEGRRYQTMDALLDYAARVAGSVGAMMAILMGARGPDALARACELGVAMQLTNIARDVGEDARAGRLYLPLDLLGAAGLCPVAFLAAPRASPALSAVVADLLGVADGLYRGAASGIALLPPGCRPAIRAARLIYADIGRTIEQNGHDSVSQRAHVPARRKAMLMARSLIGEPGAAPTRPALPGCQYLVDAATQTPPPPPAKTRLVWTFDLFERLHLQQTGAG